MKKSLLGIIFVILVTFTTSSLNANQGLPDGYDPKRNPQQDLEYAKSIANNRKILMIIGGDWCSWCNILDNYLKGDPELHNNLIENFVVLKIHFSRENISNEFLSNYPKINSYPHFIILRNDGTYIGEQNTELLESGDSYSKKLFEQFIDKWRWR
jgi:thioredoxin-related protein